MGSLAQDMRLVFWEKKRDKTKVSLIDKILLGVRLPAIYVNLFLKFRRIRNIDYIVVGYIGQLDVLFAKLFAPGKRIIFNPMISLYDTLVNDRKTVRNPLLKEFLFWLDKKSCELADLVVLDTKEHADYFKRKFKLGNVDVLYVGAEDIFKPMKGKGHSGKGKEFKILYYGKFTPLHGTRHVIETAKLLEKHKDIKFEIIGTGQTYKEDLMFARKLGVKNIKFTKWVDYKQLPEKIAESDICLGGHFDRGKKALRVVPNKVFQIIAMGKPVVINGGKAMRDAGFKDDVNCVFSEAGNPKSIAKDVLKLKKSPGLRNKTGKGARKLFVDNYSDKKIAKNLIGQMEML